MKSYEYEYQYEQVKNERLREQLAQSDQRIEWFGGKTFSNMGHCVDLSLIDCPRGRHNSKPP